MREKRLVRMMRGSWASLQSRKSWGVMFWGRVIREDPVRAEPHPTPELRPACAEAFRALPYSSHPDPVPYCVGRSLLQMGFRHQAVKVGGHSPKKLERGRKFSGADSGPYFGRGVGQLFDRFGKGSRLGNGALLVD
jgi:hypothetical protein